jgi:multicomponent Na+:H+ antiporter subunit C
MQIDTAILVGVLFGCGTYLVLRKSFVMVLFGLIIFSNAANLLVLAMSGDPNDKAAPIALEGVTHMADPLPQALILTAIVIGFGMLGYAIILLYRLFLDHKTTNAAALYATRTEADEEEKKSE